MSCASRSLRRAQLLEWVRALPLALLLASVLCAQQLFVGSALAQSVYAASGADARRTGRLHASAPREKPKQVWTVQLNERGLVAPAIAADGTLLIGSRTGLHALSPKDGAQRWLARVGPVYFTPALTDASSAIVLGGDRVFVVNAQGAFARLADLRAARAPALLDEGRAVVVGEDGFLYALSQQGELASAAATGIDRPKSLTLIAPGLALVSGEDRRVARVATDGHASRAIELETPIATTPVIGDDSSSFLLTENGHLAVLDAGGSTRANVAIEPPFIVASPALGHDGDLRVGLEAGEIVCLGPDGKERWRRGLDGRPSAISIDRDDTALLVTSRGTLYAIEKNGELRWLMATGAMRAGRPVLAADGTIYLVWRGGHVAAWR